MTDAERAEKINKDVADSRADFAAALHQVPHLDDPVAQDVVLRLLRILARSLAVTVPDVA